MGLGLKIKFLFCFSIVTQFSHKPFDVPSSALVFVPAVKVKWYQARFDSGSQMALFLRHVNRESQQTMSDIRDYLRPFNFYFILYSEIFLFLISYKTGQRPIRLWKPTTTLSKCPCYHATGRWCKFCSPGSPLLGFGGVWCPVGEPTLFLWWQL